MNKSVFIGLVIGGCLLLAGAGELIDITGGITIRTHVAPDEVALTIFNPLLPGVSVRPTWTVFKNAPAKEIELVLSTQTQEYSLAHTKFLFGNTRAIVPCDALAGDARLELVGQHDRDVISSVGVEILPPGPDCVR